MKRTEWLQDARKMRFEEVKAIEVRDWRKGMLHYCLGVCDRTFRRYIDRYEEGSLNALSDAIDSSIPSLYAD